MGYVYGGFEVPKVDMHQAQISAASRCQAGGYQQRAEPFGGQLEKCVRLGGLAGCALVKVIVEYQCIGEQPSGIQHQFH